MKILITENQLDKIIDKYITKEMGKLKKYKSPHFTRYGYGIYYFNSGIIPKCWYFQERDLFIVWASIYDDTKNVFNIKNDLICQSYFMDWAQKHLKIYPDEVWGATTKLTLKDIIK